MWLSGPLAPQHTHSHPCTRPRWSRSLSMCIKSVQPDCFSVWFFPTCSIDLFNHDNLIMTKQMLLTPRLCNQEFFRSSLEMISDTSLVVKNSLILLIWCNCYQVDLHLDLIDFPLQSQGLHQFVFTELQTDTQWLPTKRRSHLTWAAKKILVANHRKSDVSSLSFNSSPYS